MSIDEYIFMLFLSRLQSFNYAGEHGVVYLLASLKLVNILFKKGWLAGWS